MLLMRYGIKNPGIENYKSEIKALKKYNLPYDEVLAFRDSTGIYKMGREGLGIPGAAFFDSQGNYFSYLNDTVKCNAGVSPFIRALRKGAEYSADTAFSLDYLYQELVYSKDQTPLDRSELDGRYDFYVLFFWTVYTGKLNKDKVYDWYTTVEEEKRNGLNIRAYYVNLDCQEFWGYTSDELPKFKY